jgi:hypothetical protein
LTVRTRTGQTVADLEKTRTSVTPKIETRVGTVISLLGRAGAGVVILKVDDGHIVRLDFSMASPT